MSERPACSVIVPTRDRPDHLRSCLGGIAALDYPQELLQVIVVDDSGTSASVVDVGSGVELVNTDRVGPAGARNAGVERSEGVLLAFIDDDCYPRPDWLGRLVTRWQEAPAQAVGGHTLNGLADNVYAEAAQLVIDVGYAQNSAPERRWFTTNNLVVPADGFRELGGFDASYRTAEDRDFCARWLESGRRLAYEPTALVEHRHSMNLAEFAAMHFRYGRGAYRFHRDRRRRGAPVAIEPSYYAALAKEALAREGARQAAALEGLLLVWHGANTAGFVYEWAQNAGILYAMNPRDMSLRTRFFLLVALGSIVTATTAYVLHFRFLENLERQTIDMRFTLRGDQAPPKDVVIVKVDDVTFSELNTQWPFPRSMHARLLDKIRKGKPAAVAFDIQFSEYSPAEEDNALGLGLLRAKGMTVLSTTEVNEKGEANLIFDPEALKQLGARAGNANLPTDPDGIIRLFPYEVEGIKGFALVSAEVAQKGPISRKEMGASQQWIDYAGSPGTVTAYSYSRVLNGVVKPEQFAGKIVVIGATAPSLQDIHATPTGSIMSGPEIQANAIATALAGFPLRSLATPWNIVLIIALGLVVPLVSLRAGPLISVATGILAFLLFSLGTQLAFENGRVSSYIYPVAALAMATVGSIGVHYAVAAFERERVRDVFSRFVPEQVVDQVLAQADSDLRLHGKEMVTTVLFSDLRGFTSSAEDMPAETVITVLNYYLHEMSEAILAHGGTLVCYMGDGIYAIFGAPLTEEDHADRALAAAREMLLDRLPKFNDWMRENGYGDGYFMGVGLNSGPVMAGNVGHERRMDYTAVGDVVNTASRLEGMTKGTPFSVLIAESTIEMMSERPTDLTYYDELDIRGRVAKLKIWALDIRKPDDAPDLVAQREKDAKEAKDKEREAAPVPG